MKKKSVALSFLFTAILTLVLNGCGSSPSPTVTTITYTPTAVIPTLTPVLSTSTITPTPEGITITVTSAEDNGSGTLREALQVASPGDIITFDLSVFPGDDPKTIYLQSSLPGIVQGYVTVDANKAGVILEGSNIPDGWDSAIQVLSNNNVIRGLTLVNFSGAAIQISGGKDNLIEN